MAATGSTPMSNGLSRAQASAITGMGMGTILMTIFGTVWLVWGMQVAEIHGWWPGVVIFLVELPLLLAGLGVVRIGKDAGKRAGAMTPDEKLANKKKGRIFGLVFGA